MLLSPTSTGNKLKVIVTGSNPQLGRWQTQDGLKLSYVGDSLWKASCALRKSEFPIKYPFANDCFLNLSLDAPLLAVGWYRVLIFFFWEWLSLTSSPHTNTVKSVKQETLHWSLAQTGRLMLIYHHPSNPDILCYLMVLLG